MRAAVGREALAMLGRLKKVAAEKRFACLSHVSGRDPEAREVAFSAFQSAGFYRCNRCPSMVRAVTRAIEAVKKSEVTP